MAIGERIKQARNRTGLSLRELAEQVGVSAQSISKYEREISVPDSQTLIALAAALGTSTSYLLRTVEAPVLTPVYRAQHKLAKKEEKKLQADIRDWLERYLIIEKIRLSKEAGFIYPSFFPFKIDHYDEVEDAADELRKQWSLGTDTIENLIELLEQHDVKVGLVPGIDGFDGCCFDTSAKENMPVIVIRKDVPGDRQRFSLAHELGHILLKVTKRLDQEQAANRFAGAFLVPKQKVLEELGERREHLELLELYMLKHKYGLSMQGWIHRAEDLGIISSYKTKGYFRRFKQYGWKKQEPGDQVPCEKPSRFVRLVIQTLSEGIISQTRAEELLGKGLESVFEESKLGKSLANKSLNS